MEQCIYDRSAYPLLMSAKHLKNLGFSQAAAYRLLNSDKVTTVVDGTRRFAERNSFFDWLESCTHPGNPTSVAG